MDLVEVDPVGAQAAEAVLHLAHDPAPRVAELVRVVAHRAVHLGGQHHVVAPALQRLADDLLGLAARVHVRGVDEVDPGVERAVDDRGRLVVVAFSPGPEHHRAQAERADLHAGGSEVPELHCADTSAAPATPRARRRERGLASRHAPGGGKRRGRAEAHAARSALPAGAGPDPRRALLGARPPACARGALRIPSGARGGRGPSRLLALRGTSLLGGRGPRGARRTRPRARARAAPAAAARARARHPGRGRRGGPSPPPGAGPRGPPRGVRTRRRALRGLRLGLRPPVRPRDPRGPRGSRQRGQSPAALRGVQPAQGRGSREEPGGASRVSGVSVGSAGVARKPC